MVIPGGFVVFEPVLAPDTRIGVRENGDVKKPSHTGTRKHARFTPIMKVLLQYSTGYRMSEQLDVHHLSIPLLIHHVPGYIHPV